MMRLSTYVHDGQYVTEFQGFAIPKRCIIFRSNFVLWIHSKIIMERYTVQERAKIVRTFCQRNSSMMATLRELRQAIDSFWRYHLTT